MTLTLFYRFFGATVEDNRKNKTWICGELTLRTNLKSKFARIVSIRDPTSLWLARLTSLATSA